jgi:hypothetical protein
LSARLIRWIVGSGGSGLTTALIARYGWAVLVVTLVFAVVFLISLHMTCQQVDRLSSLADPGAFKGVWGVEFKSASELQGAQPKEPQAPKPRPWLRRKHPT